MFDDGFKISKAVDMFTEERRPIENITLGNYNESLNLIFGLANYDEDWDPLNNPYVDFKGHHMSSGMLVTNDIELKNCTEEEMARFIPRQNFGWYPGAMCIENRNDTTVEKNWFMEEYRVPLITMSYCKNTEQNGEWCKSKEEIEAFLE